MAGETVTCEAICLDIRPWSRTSHVVAWLTPTGRVVTVVKGAVRPKSAFLGQYDLNYTCEIVYYARAKGEMHALRECTPLALRERLRDSYRALALAEHFRSLAGELAPAGPECRAWLEGLARALDGLCEGSADLHALVVYELSVLRLSGLSPDFSGYDRNAEWSAFSVEKGCFCGDEGRIVRVSREVAAYLMRPVRPDEFSNIPLDAARVLGVFYVFHLDLALDARRTVLGLVLKQKES